MNGIMSGSKPISSLKSYINLMKVLIRNALIISSSSPYNGKSKDILIENGIITKIDDNISQEDARIVSFEGLHVSEGWNDCFSNFCDPGYEFKETLQTGIAAAAAGGFTGVMLLPNTNPVVHGKSEVEAV